jgi:hypothetical protein
MLDRYGRELRARVHMRAPRSHGGCVNPMLLDRHQGGCNLSVMARLSAILAGVFVTA